jgi:predicted O-methyltransferase YrrM
MKRSLFAFGLMIGAALLARAVLAQQPVQPGRASPPNPLLEAFDTDRDGALSAAEIDAAAAKLRECDADHDGKLTADELARGAGGGPGGAGGGRGRGPAEMEADSALRKPPLPKDDGERRILAAIDQARRRRGFASVPTRDGRLLRQLTEAVNARRVVELGTAAGVSGLWFTMALRKTGGKLYTHEINAGRVALARENFKRAGVDDIVVIVEGNAHQTATKNTDPIDVLFIDAEWGGHDAYRKELLPYIRPGGLILAHDVRRPDQLPRYVEAITTSPDLDTSFVLMDGPGIGVTLKKR